MPPPSCHLRAPPADVVVARTVVGCPPAFAACFTPEDAVALAGQVRELKAYARDAWDECGAPDEPPKQPARVAPAQ